jgi:hypothetical protein
LKTGSLAGSRFCHALRMFEAFDVSPATLVLRLCYYPTYQVLRFGGEERHVPQVSAFCCWIDFGECGNDVVPAAERNARRGDDRAAGSAGEEQQDPDTGDRECAFAEAFKGGR